MVYGLTCSNPVAVNGNIGQSPLERRKVTSDLTVNEYH